MKKLISTPKIIFITVIIVAVCIAAAQLINMNQSSSRHARAAVDESRICYISVPIVGNDTLSGIAREYYSEEFGSIESYMSRIKEYNSLTSDNIYAGNHLIVPVYQTADTL